MLRVVVGDGNYSRDCDGLLFYENLLCKPSSFQLRYMLTVEDREGRFGRLVQNRGSVSTLRCTVYVSRISHFIVFRRNFGVEGVHVTLGPVQGTLETWSQGASNVLPLAQLEYPK